MFQVSKDLCAGCGLCSESCPQGAITPQSGQAWIDQSKCNHCGICLNICPQRAIRELVPTSKNELEAAISSLKQRTNKLIERIEYLAKSG